MWRLANSPRKSSPRPVQRAHVSSRDACNGARRALLRGWRRRRAHCTKRFYCPANTGAAPQRPQCQSLAPTRAPAVLTTHLDPGAAVLHAAATRAQRLEPAERRRKGVLSADVTPVGARRRLLRRGLVVPVRVHKCNCRQGPGAPLTPCIMWGVCIWKCACSLTHAGPGPRGDVYPLPYLRSQPTPAAIGPSRAHSCVLIPRARALTPLHPHHRSQPLLPCGAQTRSSSPFHSQRRDDEPWLAGWR